jgi:hypothetical protein
LYLSGLAPITTFAYAFAFEFENFSFEPIGALYAYFIPVTIQITRLSFIVILFVLCDGLCTFNCICFPHAVTANILALPGLVDDFIGVVNWAIIGRSLIVHLKRNDANERLGVPFVDDLWENRFTCAFEGEVSVDSMQAYTYDGNSPNVEEAKGEQSAYQYAFIYSHFIFINKA